MGGLFCFQHWLSKRAPRTQLSAYCGIRCGSVVLSGPGRVRFQHATESSLTNDTIDPDGASADGDLHSENDFPRSKVRCLSMYLVVNIPTEQGSRQSQSSDARSSGNRAQSGVNLDLCINQRVREFWPVVDGNHCQLSVLVTVADSLKSNARHFERRSNAANSVENLATTGVFTSASKTPGDCSLGVSCKPLGSAVPLLNKRLPVLDTYRNFLANPPIEGLLVLKAIRTFEFAT